eukprot:CAMPEP_0198494356 /NCGR_PEP_ID=MMETSP1462-20131121/4596_1 /TAXON_ID=1333877 /ORGANISM="Brandtodinium nutriculum, Strain RCC3387" /LENGTH=695 /DNA_ID=CAMNT_0044223095 /DNA_START=92 /DNA_END=2179 /DNA_ORIENTATION=+
MASPNAFTGTPKSKTGLLDNKGEDMFEKLKDKKMQPYDKEGLAKKERMKGFAKAYAEDYLKVAIPDDQPFAGSQPKLLRKPQIASAQETARNTAVACKTITKLIESAAAGVHVVLGHDARNSQAAKAFFEKATDEAFSNSSPVIVSMASDWLQTIPYTEAEAPVRPDTMKRLFVHVGTPGKYLSNAISDNRQRFEDAFKENRLVVVCKGVCMLPLGTQEENIYGVDQDVVLDNISKAARARGQVFWGHQPGTKAAMMQKSYGYSLPGAMPEPLAFQGDAGGCMLSFCYFVEYVKYLNLVKMAKPELPVVNYYDIGLSCSMLSMTLVKLGVSLLTDQDGLTMLRDASIGQVVSKLNQLVAVEPFSNQKGVYNFFIGDGGCRCNGGVELMMHLMEGYQAESLVNMFVFNNHKWAIEDQLTGTTEREHALYNKDFYDAVGTHGRVVICENDLELREAVSFLSRRTHLYLQGKEPPGLALIVVRGIEVEVPSALGDPNPIMQSSEMAFMRNVLGKFAEGCDHKVPIYGCSAFEYIQYLHLFLEKMPEGKKYQYVCGRTDIQAAHMCGFAQPDGKCALFINDVYGINSLGESLRSVLSGFGGKQLLLMIWHPSVAQLIDQFNLHRQPLVWPNLGPELAKYYVRKESDALFVEFQGSSDAASVTAQVNEALGAGTPLVCVNILPEQERDFVSLDIRVKTSS